MKRWDAERKAERIFGYRNNDIQTDMKGVKDDFGRDTKIQRTREILA